MTGCPYCLLEAGEFLSVVIVGGRGSGKTAARLEHENHKETEAAE